MKGKEEEEREEEEDIRGMRRGRWKRRVLGGLLEVIERAQDLITASNQIALRLSVVL